MSKFKLKAKALQEGLARDWLIWKKKRLPMLTPYFLLSAAIFLFFVLLGYVLGVQDPGYGPELMSELQEMIKYLFFMSDLEMTVFIWLNNSWVVFMAMVGGLLFGILPVVILATNGLLIGLLMNVFASQGERVFFLVSTLPHGVIELGAVFLGTAFGFLAARKVFRRFNAGEEIEWRTVLSELKQGFYLLFVILFLAAVIEVYITPLYIDLYELWGRELIGLFDLST